jgi:ClpP class serine protease
MGKSFVLNTAALLRAGISSSSPICLAAGTWGQELSLSDESPEEATIAGAVAVLSIYGPLSKNADEYCGWVDGYGGEHGIVSRFTAAARDPNTKALVLKVGSPGGTSEGLEEAIASMQKATGDKPVFAWIDEHCCSAAYWIAATVAKSGVYIPRSGFAGSIGCYTAHCDLSAALSMAGEKWTIVASPPGKVAGNSIEPLDETGKERLERAVSATTSRFVDAVAASRGLSGESLMGLNGDVLPAEQAVAAGLCNAVASFDEVLEMATKAGGEYKKMELQLVNEALEIRADASLPETIAAIKSLVSAKAALKEAETALAKEKAAAELAARIKLVNEAIADGKIYPAVAYRTIEDEGVTKRVLSAWASPPHAGPNGEALGQSFEQLKAFVDSAPSVRQNTKVPLITESATDEKDERLAAQCGMSVEDYRRTRAAVSDAAKKGQTT